MLCLLQCTHYIHTILNRYQSETPRVQDCNKTFWENLSNFLQCVQSTVGKHSSLFEIVNHDYMPDCIAVSAPNNPYPFFIPYYSTNRLKMTKSSWQEFEKGRNMYVWNLVNKIDWADVWLSANPFSHGQDVVHVNCDVKDNIITNYSRVFTEKKRCMLELIAKLIAGCLYYSIKDLISKGQNVVFAISGKFKYCKELVELIFINNNMIKKLLNCTIIIPHCNRICWYEEGSDILIMSEPNLPDDCNNNSVILLKLFDILYPHSAQGVKVFQDHRWRNA